MFDSCQKILVKDNFLPICDTMNLVNSVNLRLLLLLAPSPPILKHQKKFISLPFPNGFGYMVCCMHLIPSLFSLRECGFSLNRILPSLSLYGKILVTENPYPFIYYVVASNQIYLEET